MLTPASGVGLATLTLVGCCLLAPLAAVAAPESSAKFTRPGLPITVEMGGRPFTFEQKEPGWKMSPATWLPGPSPASDT